MLTDYNPENVDLHDFQIVGTSRNPYFPNVGHYFKEKQIQNHFSNLVCLWILNVSNLVFWELSNLNVLES